MHVVCTGVARCRQGVTSRVEQSKIQYHLKYNIIWIIHHTGGSLDGLSRIFCTAATSMRWTTAPADIVIVIRVTGVRGQHLRLWQRHDRMRRRVHGSQFGNLSRSL